MKKVDTYIIVILCAILVCCNNAKNKDRCDNICIPLLDNVLDSVYLSKYKQDDNKNIIVLVFFYAIDTNKFLIIGPAPCIHSLSKSYYEYKNYIIDYVGVDNTVVNIVLPLDRFKTEYPVEGYISCNDLPYLLWDVEPKTYLIHGKDSLTLFNPDKEHKRILWDIFEKKGFWVPPPTPIN